MSRANFLPWWTPAVAGGEIAMLTKVIASGYLNDGDVTDALARRLAERLGVPHAVAVTSGTAAIACALFALGVGTGDEVLIPDVTFIATANAVTLTGARPVLVDVEPISLAMDPDAARRAITPRTKALLPVHVSGRAGTLAEIISLAKSHGLPVVEDAAEALGVIAEGKPWVPTGNLDVFPFRPTKPLPPGKGV